MMTHWEVEIWRTYFISNVKSGFGKPSNDTFISFIFLDRISLITKDEAEGSSVTSEEAEKVSFFNEHLFV